MAAAELARGRTISVKPVPSEINYFVLADQFGWPPDVIDRQDAKKMKGIMHVLSVYNKVRNTEIEKMNKKKNH